MNRNQFDLMIGRLDRILSQMIRAAESKIDLEDVQTLKHHAEDMIGAGTKILKILKVKK